MENLLMLCPKHHRAAHEGAWTLTGTAQDGTRRHVRGCDFYTFRSGKVIRKDSYWKIVE